MGSNQSSVSRRNRYPSKSRKAWRNLRIAGSPAVRGQRSEVREQRGQRDYRTTDDKAAKQRGGNAQHPTSIGCQILTDDPEVAANDGQLHKRAGNDPICGGRAEQSNNVKKIKEFPAGYKIRNDLLTQGYGIDSAKSSTLRSTSIEAESSAPRFPNNNPASVQSRNSTTGEQL